MSVTLNHLSIAGNLTRDVQIRFLANERCVASFGIANSRKFKSGGETREETVFLDCEAWGETAERIGKFFAKGKPVILEGRLKQETWIDKKDGTKRSKLLLSVKEFHFVPDGKRDHAASDTTADAGETAPARAPAPAATGDDDEPPF